MNQRLPLTGLEVIEFVSIGPGPHAAMLLADEAADHPHTRARAGYAVIDGVLHATPAPRFMQP